MTVARRDFRPFAAAAFTSRPIFLPAGSIRSPRSTVCLGVQWLVRLLDPRLFPEPLGPRVKAFLALDQHRVQSDMQPRALLDGGVNR